MPRREKPPRLLFDRIRKQWVLRYRQVFKRLPYGEAERDKAEAQLQKALANKSGMRGVRSVNVKSKSTSIWTRSKLEGEVYFVSKAGCVDYPIKIGFSCAGSRPRVGNLQTGNPHILELITACPGMYATEQSLHAILAVDRVFGEWFNRTTQVMSALEAAKLGNLIAWVEDHRHALLCPSPCRAQISGD